tara:strand:- start:264 stop:530 length:267 start_codon:yes stop_codon:yes gene_type:complete
MKRLYIIDYWVPFPSSEYGGMIVLIANNNKEAEQLLVEQSEERNNIIDAHLGVRKGEYDANILLSVERASSFELSGNPDSGIVRTFLT